MEMIFKSEKAITMKRETITISSSQGKKKIQKDKIVFCKQYLVGTLIELQDGNHYLLKEKLDELMHILSDNTFFFVSNRELINMDYLEAVFSDQVVLSNGKSFNVNPIRKMALLRKSSQEAWT
jgi:DNA-binding LytR/AlgR family response regulator